MGTRSPDASFIAVVDLRFGWVGRVGDIDVQPFAGIDNLLDERYNSSGLANEPARLHRPVLPTLARPGDLRRVHPRWRLALTLERVTGHQSRPGTPPTHAVGPSSHLL